VPPASTTRPQSQLPDAETPKRIRALAAIQCNQAQAASVLLIHEDTFHQFLRRHINAREAWKMGKQEGFATLLQNQFQMSKKSAQMAIHLGRYYLNQIYKRPFDDGDIPLPPTDGGLEHISEEATALLWAAKQANKSKKDDENGNK
jgi:hypothetical protein